MESEQLKGKFIHVIYDDGNRVTQKTGKVTDTNSQFVYIEHDGICEAIAIARIVRFEIKNGG